ncbi:MAG TPA: PKD domain-containing protein [Deltaproteobacteria bacterium]|nr:PKD domain-containing protein [Deltaproteobacteria bacterium]
MRLSRSLEKCRDRWSARSLIPILIALFFVFVGAGCGTDSDDARIAFRAETPSASFSQDRTNGTPGLAVRFDDTSTGNITSRTWDFGPLGTSREANPTIVFPDVGTYDVALTVRGPRGMSRAVKQGLIEIGLPPTAGFSCVSTTGFAPFSIDCLDESTDATRISWDFGDGATSTGTSGQHVYPTPGVYSLEQTVSSGGGSDRATATIEVLSFGITASPATGSAPVDVTFTGDTGGRSGLAIWTIDNKIVSTAPVLQHRFRNPGTFLVSFVFGVPGTSISAQQTIEYVVGYGPAEAAFSPSVSGGSGPLEVVLMDESTGAIDRWEWDFGDGSRCVFPAPADPDPNDPVDVCDSSSPRHVYENVGNYDVSLRVTGPGPDVGDPAVVSSTTTNNAVRVYIRDPGFELQSVNGTIGNGWTALRPPDATENATHIALSNAQGGADVGMPTEGTRWAVLDGLGTDGTTPVDRVENGIRQDFLIPSEQTVLEFDYVLLYAEPPASPVLDATTATVSDGTTTVEIPGARADVSTAYVGPSLRFPSRDGSTVRATPVLTASLDLATAFPDATDETLLTLTIRVANATNGLRSPRVYVDDIRFTRPADTLTADFILDTDPVVVGRPARFIDDSCPDPASTCLEPTSWRWDFDTRLLPTPPSASGSGEQDPTYVFPEAGVYDVRLKARLADLESETGMLVNVIEGPVAAFASDPPAGPHVAPATLVFTDQSTFDASDPIVAWSWDFGGWGVSPLQDPAAVTIGQAGDWIIRLTVTTASGQTDTTQTTITVE